MIKLDSNVCISKTNMICERILRVVAALRRFKIKGQLHILTYGKYVVTFGVDEMTSEIEIHKKNNSNLFKHELVLTIPISVALVLNT